MTTPDPLLDPSVLCRAIVDRFDPIEREDQRVAAIYLNKREIDTLVQKANPMHFDRVSELRLYPLKGILWGAKVYVNEHVAEGCAVFVPDDIEVTITGPRCGVRLVPHTATSKDRRCADVHGNESVCVECDFPVET